jgi:hypothetical protein
MALNNVEYDLDGDKLIIEIDLSKGGFQPSKSGKSLLIAMAFPPEEIEYEKIPGLRFNLTCSADVPQKPAAPRERVASKK